MNFEDLTGFFMDSRVKDPDGALYNLKTDPDEKKMCNFIRNFNALLMI